MASEFGWLDDKHAIFEEWEEVWKRNENRLRGGHVVLDELTPFEWEVSRNSDGSVKSVTEHYKSRQQKATYLNFPDMFATAMCGHLLREAPEADTALDFGQLGQVRRTDDSAEPTEAEVVYYNVDGVGVQGSQWDNFWFSVSKRSLGTGHRWLFIDATEDAPMNLEDVISGKRPYIVEYSPLSVPLWHFSNGRLDFAVIKQFRSAPKVKDGKLTGMDREKMHSLLVVRQGFDGLGERFAGGGWWLFNPDHEIVMRDDVEAHKPWESTNGEIPMFPVFYERDSGTPGRPAMSRPALTELGQLAVSYMDMSSAADYDAHDAAGSLLLLLGVSQEAYNIAIGKIKSGNKIAPVPMDEQTSNIPQIHDASTGTVAAEVFERRLEAKRLAARDLASMEATSTPDSSGESKRAGFAEVKAPRLAQMASELEQAQNTALHFLEMRFGHAKPSGSVRWPREFDLTDLIDEIRNQFDLERLSGLRSTTVGATAMTKAARQNKLINDDEEAKTVENEYRTSANDRTANESRARQLDQEIFG